MKSHVPLDQARHIADQILDRFAPACLRIEVVGSIRRAEPVIGDIELIAIPATDRPVFGANPDKWNWTRVDHLLAELDSAGKIDIVAGNNHRGPERKMVRFMVIGSKNNLYQVELWLQPSPSTYGMNKMFRTGDRYFAQWMITSSEKGGALPPGWWSDDAILHDADGNVVATPEEEDVFTALGLPFVEPQDRQGPWVRLNRWKAGL